MYIIYSRTTLWNISPSRYINIENMNIISADVEINYVLSQNN